MNSIIWTVAIASALAASGMSLGAHAETQAIGTASAEAKPGADPDRDQLKSKISKLKQTLDDLQTKVQDASKSTNELADPKTAQKTVAELQTKISEALSQTADNGDVALLAKKVLETEQGWLAGVKIHGFTAERQALLENSYNAIIADTVTTSNGLTEIRHELTDILKKMQGEQDYLEELARIDQSKEMLAVLKNLLSDLRATTDKIKVLIDGVPGA
jgi:DNA repair exonuclease SbcCD ATPase subunit